MAEAGLTTPVRLAHFLAQICHETNGLSLYEEGLNYRADRLPVIWPKRFKPLGPLEPVEYANKPERLANAVYAGRMGNTEPGDGYRYRGRGLLQTTGRMGYESATKALRSRYIDAPDLIQDPDQVMSTEWCLRVALSYWTGTGCNTLADQGDIKRLTRTINGGLTGLDDRTAWFDRIHKELGL